MRLNLTLTTPDGRTFMLAEALELVPVAVPDPVIDSVDPARISAAGGETITIRGRHFPQGSTILIGDRAATDVVIAPDGLSLTCVTPSFE
jgi:hypothetical protein